MFNNGCVTLWPEWVQFKLYLQLPSMCMSPTGPQILSKSWLLHPLLFQGVVLLSSAMQILSFVTKHGLNIQHQTTSFVTDKILHLLLACPLSCCSWPTLHLEPSVAPSYFCCITNFLKHQGCWSGVSKHRADPVDCWCDQEGASCHCISPTAHCGLCTSSPI